MIHSSVIAVTGGARSDVRAVFRGSWPQLALIKTQTEFRVPTQDLYIAQHSNFQLLAKLQSMQGWQSGTAYIVSPRTEVNPRNSIAAAFAHLQSSDWRKASSLSVTVYNQAMAVAAQLAQSDWPCLKTLQLSDCRLRHACMHQLAKGSWPKLELLNLSSNQLDEAAIAALTQGKWPLLTKLTLNSMKVLTGCSWRWTHTYSGQMGVFEHAESVVDQAGQLMYSQHCSDAQPA